MRALPSAPALFLAALPRCCREVPIPEHLDMYHLHQEAEPSDMTALEAVVDHIKKEMERLHAQVRACARVHARRACAGASSGARQVLHAGLPQRSACAACSAMQARTMLRSGCQAGFGLLRAHARARSPLPAAVTSLHRRKRSCLSAAQTTSGWWQSTTGVMLAQKCDVLG
jgi:hypothetical protein